MSKSKKNYVWLASNANKQQNEISFGYFQDRIIRFFFTFTSLQIRFINTAMQRICTSFKQKIIQIFAPHFNV